MDELPMNIKNWLQSLLVLAIRFIWWLMILYVVKEISWKLSMSEFILPNSVAYVINQTKNGRLEEKSIYKNMAIEIKEMADKKSWPGFDFLFSLLYHFYNP